MRSPISTFRLGLIILSDIGTIVLRPPSTCAAISAHVDVGRSTKEGRKNRNNFFHADLLEDASSKSEKSASDKPWSDNRTSTIRGAPPTGTSSANRTTSDDRRAGRRSTTYGASAAPPTRAAPSSPASTGGTKSAPTMLGRTAPGTIAVDHTDPTMDVDHTDGDGLAAPHKSAWPPSGVEVGAFLLSLVGLLLAASGGIGGGGFIVPIYVMMLDFSARQAVALSNVTILGGSLANFIFNVGKMRVNEKNEAVPLIDWNLILVMEPTTIAGAILGTYLTTIFPDVILSWLLCVVLAAMGVGAHVRAARSEGKHVLHEHMEWHFLMHIPPCTVLFSSVIRC